MTEYNRKASYGISNDFLDGLALVDMALFSIEPYSSVEIANIYQLGDIYYGLFASGDDSTFPLGMLVTIQIIVIVH